MYASRPTTAPALAAHLASEFATRARFCPERKAYLAPAQGRESVHSGLVRNICARHHPQRPHNTNKRRRGTNVVGSSAAIGTRVDAQLAAACAQRPVARPHSMTTQLLRYWAERGHTLEAAQVPVRVPGFYMTMTQADVITSDRAGRLWLWEVKTGAPVGFHRRSGEVKHVGGATVPCNGLAVWHLQLYYTRCALEAAGVPIANARIIQIHGQRKGSREDKIVVHEPPEWTLRVQQPL